MPRLIQLSDIHFGAQDVAALAAATTYVATTTPELVLITGDITQWGHQDEFIAARAWLRGLTVPTISTPGNHDTPWMGLLERIILPFRRYERAIGPSREADFAGPGFAVRTLNSARGWQIRLNWSKGEVGRRQTARAIRSLRGASPDAVRLLACHHPLMEVPGEPMTSRVRGGRRAAQRLCAAGLDVVLTGHLHAPFVQALPFGDERTFAVGAGTLSLRQRGARPSFNVIEIEGDRLSITVMAWTGQRLEIDQSWNVSLRPRAAADAAASAGKL